MSGDSIALRSGQTSSAARSPRHWGASALLAASASILIPTPAPPSMPSAASLAASAAAATGIGRRDGGQGNKGGDPAGRHAAAHGGRRPEIPHAGERNAFLREADLADRQVRTLCMTLAYAGFRCPRRWRSPPIASTSPPACWWSRASRSAARGSSDPCQCPLPCPRRSTWSTASASGKRAGARAAASTSGCGRG